METNIEVVGQKIVEFRLMTQEERDKMGWGKSRAGFVIVLENGVKIIPCDYGGNCPGEVFVVN